MPHSAPAWLPPYLWPCCDYCVPLSTWLVSWSYTVAQQVGVWFTQVEYKGPWTLQGDCATFVKWWRENASSNLSHWRRCISAFGSQSLGIITEDGTWCCPWSILQDLFGQYKGQKAKDKPEYNTAFMSKPRGYYNAQTLPTLWKKRKSRVCFHLPHPPTEIWGCEGMRYELFGLRLINPTERCLRKPGGHHLFSLCHAGADDSLCCSIC